ncbi:tRNA (guanosine(46)-N7)-methyltransferase TrmB [Alkalibacterium putridalgicola]|jgi:tRNA (guanine-N7-)-methyltransferase|uniref:tRNA (guanine-N(7)-)-methyltransferase n=1 Tax=Alkalibacterium putridalgicola TaxID=426703 RepID=A0A1H7SY29_9LACT|nr:tRNA (guanosine(46)-N7)-methyltransferase TrmB [Alkalibacterium putridalgicola]GEK89245.1 tRNA (guanine-N(7)-)-methyltransferase [Alkalibacterium putridalgicola]SEL77511.1 tRNA (guanine-N7-)-methyltransferase [Alkalibacterium putridalgicola]
MRLRHKPYAKEKLAEYDQYVVTEALGLKGRWQERFGNENPIHVEIGCGKGQFIINMAKQHPEINFIGIELQTSVIVTALEKQIEEDLPNVQLLQANASDLAEYFEENKVDRIYLTFSDPWPKNRHEKRRLTYKSFLKVYETILNPEGELHFKTDNQKLFEYSLVSFSHYSAKLNEVYLDLHNSDVTDNVMTEYEEKFSKKGNRIYKAVLTFDSSE